MKRLIQASSVIALALAIVAGCSRQEHALSTGQVIAAKDLDGHKGDAAYAVVNPDCLPSLYDDFRDELSRRGIVKWDERLDCNKFASHYISKAQTRYAVAAWHSNTKAQSLALAEVWVAQPDGTYHAIVQARTPAGDVYVEPQTGKVIPLPGYVYFRKW